MVLLIMVGVTNPIVECSPIFFFVCVFLWTEVSVRTVVYTASGDVTTSKEKMYLDMPVAVFFIGVPH